MNKLTNAISILYDMEMNNYFMTKTINELEEAANKLGIAEEITPPRQEFAFWTDALKTSCFLSIFLCLIIGAIFGIIGGFAGTPGFGGLFAALGGAIVFGLIGALVGVVLGLILSIPFYFVDKKLKDKVNFQKNQAYKAKCLEQEKIIDKENKAKEILLFERDNLIKHKLESVIMLNKFYSVVGIAPEFQSLIPIGYMYNFSKLGISTKLEGVDGLYYLVNKELRMDQLQYTLEDISKKNGYYN